MRYTNTEMYESEGIIEMPPGQPGITINDYVISTWHEGGSTIEALHETRPIDGYGRYVALVWLRCINWQFGDNAVSIYGPLMVTQPELTRLQNAEYPLKVPALPAV